MKKSVSENEKISLASLYYSMLINNLRRNSRDNRIDSLLSQLPKANEDTNKVKLLIDLSHTNYSINPDEGLKFGKQALALAEKLNWKKGMGNACRTIAGNYGYGKSDYAPALKYSLKALQQFREIGDKLGTARILSDLELSIGTRQIIRML